MSPTVTLNWKTLTLFAFVLLGTLAGALLGTLAVGLSRAADHEQAGSSQVRVLAEQREDGRIAVSVQQQQVDGSWGRIYAPTRRLIPADLEPGRRLASSPINLNVDDGAELLRHEQQQAWANHAQFVAGRLNAAGGGAVICLNLDPHREGLERYCNHLEAAYDGAVMRVSGTDPDAVERDLRAAVSSADSLVGIAVTNFAGGVVGNRVVTDLGERIPLTIHGSLLPRLLPNREADYCFLTHGSPGFFWGFVNSSASVAALHNGIGLRNYQIANAEEHSAAIRECVANGATALTTTLGDPEGVREALTEAQAAGVRVVSFNSGANAAPDLGSAVHIAVDEQAIGEKAGDAFNRHEVSGDVLCVIHESGNIGLNERCEGLEAAYQGGSVEVFPAYEAESRAGAVQLLAQRLGEGGVGAVFTLSSDAARGATQAIRLAQSDAQLATVGFSGSVYEQALRGEIMFVIWDMPILQAYLSVASMLLADQLQIRPAEWFGSPQLLIEPRLYEPADVVQLLGQLIDTSR